MSQTKLDRDMETATPPEDEELRVATEVAAELLRGATVRSQNSDLSAIGLLEQEARRRLEDGVYPGPDCLSPAELENLTAGEEAGSDRLRHASSCTDCTALLRAAKPPEEVLTRIHEELARVASEDSAEAPPQASQPKRDSEALEDSGAILAIG